VNSAAITAPGLRRDEELTLQTTGYWASVAAGKPPTLRVLAPLAATLAWLLSSMPVTFGGDPWDGTRARQTLTRGATALEPASSRRIGLREARSLALRTLFGAEERRLRAAQMEADRTAGWEDLG